MQNCDGHPSAAEQTTVATRDPGGPLRPAPNVTPLTTGTWVVKRSQGRRGRGEGGEGHRETQLGIGREEKKLPNATSIPQSPTTSPVHRHKVNGTSKLSTRSYGSALCTSGGFIM